MYCNMCGQKLPDGSKYCYSCGAKVPDIPPKTDESAYRYVPPKGSTREVIGRTEKKTADTSAEYRYVPPKETARETVPEREKKTADTSAEYRYVPPKETARETVRDTKATGSAGRTATATTPDDMKAAEAAEKRSAEARAAAVEAQERAAEVVADDTSAGTGCLGVLFGILKSAFIAMLVFMAIMFACDKIDAWKAEKEAADFVEVVEETPSPQELALAARLPNVPEELRELKVLQHRGMGSCKELRGNIAVTVVFVDDTVSRWTQQEMNTFAREAEQDYTELTKLAAQWGVPLNITMSTAHVAVDFEMSPELAQYNKNNMLELAGFNSFDLNNTLKTQTGADAVPILFAFNKNGRAYAEQNSNAAEVQCAYLFGGTQALKHEFLHLFGASDFYYHDLMSFAAADILNDSIMRDSANEHVDDLTAYLIGWTDSLSDHATAMLYLIGYIGNEELQTAIDENTLTGFGTVNYDDGGIYTGYLTMGTPDGWGEMRFPSGDVYVGEFKDGAIHGYGKYTKADGSVFDGYWENGYFQG